jgi:hypothetical protein
MTGYVALDVEVRIFFLEYAESWYLCIKKKKWSNYNKTTPHLGPE